MALSFLPGTKTIFVPQSYLTALGGGRYELDVNQLRLDCRDWEDTEIGIVQDATHAHNTQVTLGGTTYARQVEFTNFWAIEFEYLGSPYEVTAKGANHNIADVKVVNGVSLITNNAAGLIVASVGSGLSAAQDSKLSNINSLLSTIEGTFNHRDVMRILLAAAAGHLSIDPDGTVHITDLANGKDRITASTTEAGERTGVTLDATD